MSASEHLQKIYSLIKQGSSLLNNVSCSEGKRNFYISDSARTDSRDWVMQTISILHFIVPTNSIIHKECNKTLEDEYLNSSDVPVHVIEKLNSLLKTVKIDIEEGRFSRWEYNISAQNFDEFLMYAEHFHSGNKKMEAAIIASAVLEDTIKTIARKNNLDSSGALDVVINRLTDNGIFTKVKKTRMQSLVSIRNKSFHAEWEEFDIRDVGRLISEIRELVDNFIAVSSVSA